ncbi:hypothetical protein ACA910_018696 [Epithemia clementina (nom. ined.)]
MARTASRTASPTSTTKDSHKSKKGTVRVCVCFLYSSQYLEYGNGRPCRYDGHCPDGMTCGVASSSESSLVTKKESSTTTTGIRSEKANDEKKETAINQPGQCLYFPITTSPQISFASSYATPTTNVIHEQNVLSNWLTHYLKECREACQAELEMDEHFYHRAWPNIVSTSVRATVATTRPKGCVLDYVRLDDNVQHWKDLHAKDGTVPDEEPEPSFVTWEKTRFRHIVRVDPILPSPLLLQTKGSRISKNTTTASILSIQSDKQQQWRAYCTAPCQSDHDCETASTTGILDQSKRPWKCVDGACQRNPKFWEVTVERSNLDTLHERPNSNSNSNTRSMQQQRRKDAASYKEMVIVTGATDEYFLSMKNLVASARYWAPKHRVVVYNLGGLDSAMDDIRSWPNVIAMEWFDNKGDGLGGIPNQFPPHVHASKIYAWKPIILEQALKKYGMILWLDAGSTLTGPIDPIESIVKRNGIFLVKGQDADMKHLSHPDSYKWFGWKHKKNFPHGRPHYSGNTQAYLYPSRFVQPIVERNAACAWDASCIAPSGATLRNHRFDQTTLSLCAYHPWVRPPHHTEYLACSESQVPEKDDMPWIPSYRMVWTARQTCEDCYSMDETDNYLDRGILPMDWTKINPDNRTKARAEYLTALATRRQQHQDRLPR